MTLAQNIINFVNGGEKDSEDNSMMEDLDGDTTAPKSPIVVSNSPGLELNLEIPTIPTSGEEQKMTLAETISDLLPLIISSIPDPDEMVVLFEL